MTGFVGVHTDLTGSFVPRTYIITVRNALLPELGGAPDRSTPGQTPINSAIGDEWVPVADELNYTNPAVSIVAHVAQCQSDCAGPRSGPQHRSRGDSGGGSAVHRGFPVVRSLLDQTIDGPTQVDESGKVCSGYKGQEPPRNGRFRGGSSRSGRPRWRGRYGDQLTLAAACRDSLRVIRGQPGIDYSGGLEPEFRRLKTSPSDWERSGPTDSKPTERWSVTTEQSSTKTATYPRWRPH